jgi:hypothetical protein
MTRKYDRRNGCFKRGWFLEAYKFGALHKLPSVLPITNELLMKLTSLKNNLNDAACHWKIKVQHMSAEILNGPCDIFTPQHMPVYFSLLKSAVELCNRKTPLSSHLSYYVARFLLQWRDNQRFIA